MWVCLEQKGQDLIFPRSNVRKVSRRNTLRWMHWTSKMLCFFLLVRINTGFKSFGNGFYLRWNTITWLCIHVNLMDVNQLNYVLFQQGNLVFCIWEWNTTSPLIVEYDFDYYLNKSITCLSLCCTLLVYKVFVYRWCFHVAKCLPTGVFQSLSNYLCKFDLFKAYTKDIKYT